MLTTRQAEVLGHLRRMTAEAGTPPTLRELADAIGVASTFAAVCHLRALERKGKVRRGGRGKARSWVAT